MCVNIQEWHQSYGNFEEQVSEFNKKIKKSDLSNEGINQIYAIVQREVKRLGELLTEVTRREKELENTEHLSKGLIQLGLISGVAKITTIAGFILGILGRKDSIAMGIGCGIFAVGEVFDWGTFLYDRKISLLKDERSELVKLNKEGVEHAKIFCKFLQQLREIKQIETHPIGEYETETRERSTDHVPINLNASLDNSSDSFKGSFKDLNCRISSCLKDYEELPRRYRREDVYCRIISHLIQKLPLNDPLYIGLNKLEPTTLFEDVSQIAEHPLTTQYLPPTMNRRSSSSEGERNALRWNAEEQSHSNLTPLEMKNDTAESEFKTHARGKYEEQVAYYKNLVMQRFQLSFNIPYFETPQGWQITPQGEIKKIENIVEEEKKGDLIPTSTKELEFPLLSRQNAFIVEESNSTTKSDKYFSLNGDDLV